MKIICFMYASFDGRTQDKNPVLLDLQEVEKLEKGTVLLKYKVKKQIKLTINHKKFSEILKLFL